jgi:hypothetical protein
MTEHAWVIENVDGGPMGDCDFWKCPTCGVGGGPVWPKMKGKAERWPAFIPGPARKVSEDCEEAQAQIRSYILDDSLPNMQKRWCAPQAEVIIEAVRATEAKNLMAVIHLIFDIVNPRVKGYCMPVGEVRERLKAGLTSSV